jgi:uncharacterized protein YbjT (DUF2867 family)
MIKKILVIGGTGMLGFPVAKQLKIDGYTSDILTTNPDKAAKKFGDGFNYISGDVKSESELRKTLKDYDGAHINLNSNSYKDLQEIEVNGCRNIVNSLKGSEVKKITLISGLGVSEANTHIPFIKAKMEMEHAVRNSGVAYTIFNCTHFMESIPLYIRNGKAMIMGKQNHKIHWLAAEDYARMVSRSFELKASDFKNYSIIGPEEFTMEEVFKQYIGKRDPDLKITKVSLGILGFIASITFNSKLKYLVELMRYFDTTPERYDAQNFPEVLGQAKTSLNEWLSEGNS